MAQVDFVKEWREQGVDVRENGDHILEIWKDGQRVASFSQTGVKIDNVLKEIKAGKYDN